MAADYRTSPDIACATVPGGAVIIHLGTNKYFSLNATAALVWSHLDAGEHSTTIAAALVRDFRIDDETAQNAVSRTIAQFEEAGLLERT